MALLILSHTPSENRLYQVMRAEVAAAQTSIGRFTIRRLMQLTDSMSYSTVRRSLAGLLSKLSIEYQRVACDERAPERRSGIYIVYCPTDIPPRRRAALQPITLCPTVRFGLSKARPPHFIQITQHPIGLLLGRADQPLASFLFRSYSESRLVIQSRARCQLTPRRRRAERMVSSLTWARASTFPQQTSATVLSAQSECARSVVRGLWCKMARNCSRFPASSSGVGVFGREDFCSRQARPSLSYERSTLRTVWSAQPSCRAIRRGVCPEALESRIWLRRTVKAWLERRAVRNFSSSFSHQGRTKIGSFIAAIFAHFPSIQRGLMVFALAV